MNNQQEQSCHRRRLNYCTFKDSRCEFEGREYGCAVYRHDCVEASLRERTSQMIREMEHDLQLERAGEENE